MRLAVETSEPNFAPEVPEAITYHIRDRDAQNYGRPKTLRPQYFGSLSLAQLPACRCRPGTTLKWYLPVEDLEVLHTLSSS